MKKIKIFTTLLVFGILLQNLTAAEWEKAKSLSFKVDKVNYMGFYDKSFGVIVGAEGYIQYSKNGGKSWKAGKNTSRCRFCLDIVDENLVWAGGDGNHVRVSKDGGKTWSAVTDLSLFGMHKTMDFLDENYGWIASNRHLAVTEDGGTSWREIGMPEDDDASGIAAVVLADKETGYLLFNSGRMICTNDAGATWTNVNVDILKTGIKNEKNKPGLLKTGVPLAAIHFSDKLNGTLVFSGIIPGNGSHLYCYNTNDGGKSWTETEIGLENGYTPTSVYLNEAENLITVSNAKRDIVLYQLK